MKRVLVTTTSFQDVPGEHHQLLVKEGLEIIKERGPFDESGMLKLVGEIDGIICGEDALTRTVFEKAAPRLTVVSKYGVGLDKIDLKAATEFKIPITYCPGVNHTTVAELTFALLLSIYRNIIDQCFQTKNGEWKRRTGRELNGKIIGIIGLGRSGKEVALRANAFGMKIMGYGNHWDEDFAKKYNLLRMKTIEELLKFCDVVTLHTSTDASKKNLLNAQRIGLMRKGAVLINTASAELVEQEALIQALKSGQLDGYGTDVFEQEPPPKDHPLFTFPNVVVTPHIGSRTFENVMRQAKMAAENLIFVFQGKSPIAQANTFNVSKKKKA